MRRPSRWVVPSRVNRSSRKVDVAPPVALDARGEARVPGEAAEPPDQETLLGATPGIRIEDRSTSGQIRKIGPVVRVGQDSKVAVVLIVAVRVRGKVHVAGVSIGCIDFGVRSVGLRRTSEVLTVTPTLAVKAIPDAKADSGLYEPFRAMAEVMQHLRLSAFIAEAHHNERLADCRAYGAPGHEAPFQISEPWSSPQPHLVDAA